jgi:hypothetical protein
MPRASPSHVFEGRFILGIDPADNEAGECWGHCEGANYIKSAGLWRPAPAGADVAQAAHRPCG